MGDTTPPRQPERLITQNSGLRRHGIFNFSLPAWAGRLPDGRTYNWQAAQTVRTRSTTRTADDR